MYVSGSGIGIIKNKSQLLGVQGEREGVCRQQRLSVLALRAACCNVSGRPFSRGTAVRPASLPTCTKPFSPDALSAQSWGRAVEMRGDCQCEHSYHCVKCTCVITTTKSSRRRTSAIQSIPTTYCHHPTKNIESSQTQKPHHLPPIPPHISIYTHA